MENVEVRTIKYAGLDSCCEITLGQIRYYFGLNNPKVVKDYGPPTYLVGHVDFSAVPEEVQREYLLWKMSSRQH